MRLGEPKVSLKGRYLQQQGQPSRHRCWCQELHPCQQSRSQQQALRCRQHRHGRRNGQWQHLDQHDHHQRRRQRHRRLRTEQSAAALDLHVLGGEAGSRRLAVESHEDERGIRAAGFEVGPGRARDSRSFRDLLLRQAAADTSNPDAEATALLARIDGGLTPETLGDLVAHLRDSKALRDTHERAKAWAQAAVDALGPLPEGSPKQALITFARAIVDRDA